MDNSLKKATIRALKGKDQSPITVLFNPSEYTLERSNSYKVTQVPGLRTPLLQFVNGESDQLTMDLFFDDYTDPNGPQPFTPGGPDLVARSVDRLFALLEIDASLHAPPPVLFKWGNLNFTAVIERLSRKVTLFTPAGMPARVTVSVTFKEQRPIGQQLREPGRESPDKSKRRLIVGLDTIYLLAFREYNDVTRWREIATANDLDDPREIAAGDWLLVPPLEDEDGPRNPF